MHSADDPLLVARRFVLSCAFPATSTRRRCEAVFIGALEQTAEEIKLVKARPLCALLTDD
jgi:hypothetical protein